LSRRRGSSQPGGSHERYRKEEPLHIHSSDEIIPLMIKTAEVGPGRQGIDLSLRFGVGTSFKPSTNVRLYNRFPE
jgi:hypothetical protein